MFIPDPGSHKKKKKEKIFLSYHFSGYKFYKIENNYISEKVQKNVSSNWQKNLIFSTQKIVTKLSDKWI